MLTRLLLVPLFVLLASPAWAAIVCADATETATTTTTDPETIAYTTPAGSNQILIVGVSMRDSTDTISGATHAGNAMTAVTTEAYSGDVVHTQIFYRVNPTSGTNNVVVDWSGAVLSDAIVILTCSGVNTADPIRAFNTATGASGTAVTVTVASVVTGDMVVDMYGGDSQTVEATEGADQTGIHKGLIGTEHGYGSSYQLGAAGGVMSWTQNVSNDWAIMAVALKPAVSGSRPVAPLLME